MSAKVCRLKTEATCRRNLNGDLAVRDSGASFPDSGSSFQASHTSQADLDRISQAAGRGTVLRSLSDSSSSRNADSPAALPEAAAAAGLRPSASMFGSAADGYPPTSSFGFPQQNASSMTFQSGLPSITAATALSQPADGLEMQEGANASYDADGQEIPGTGDDVSRQRERNRSLSCPKASQNSHDHIIRYKRNFTAKTKFGHLIQSCSSS